MGATRSRPDLAHPYRYRHPVVDAAPLVVLMGVAGSGKTTIGRRVAAALRVPFLDADELHDPSDVERMRAGVPLDDTRREPWLDRVRAALVARRDTGAVVACSALRAGYRDRLTAGLPEVRVVALVAAPETIRARLEGRVDHFADETLLDSQLATLELDETVACVDAEDDPDAVTGAVLDVLR